MNDSANHSDAQQVRYIQSRWAFPVTSPPIKNAIIASRSGIVESIEPYSTAKHSSLDSVDLGDSAIFPGFVNAHTHLEFSNLPSPLGHRGIDFADWIREVLKFRFQSDMTAEQAKIELDSAYQNGMAELIQSGTVCCGDIATTNPADIDFDSLVELVSFRELIGLSQTRMNSTLELLDTFLRTHLDGKNIRHAISPHSPYTCHLAMLDRACAESRDRNLPVAMHLAETKPELELLKEQSGTIYDFLNEVGVWNEAAFEEAPSVMTYLEKLARAEKSLVVHGNYLTDQEQEFVAQQGDSMSIIFCPRTHDYFEHDPYPLETLLNLGINVALGTDSRASNPDLSVWSEAEYVTKKFGQIRPTQILKMVTYNGALALGLDHQYGSIEAKKSGRLIHSDIDSQLNEVEDVLSELWNRVSSRPVFERV